MCPLVPSSMMALLSVGLAMAAPLVRQAPNISAEPANQLVVAGNACGPVALFNALRFGNDHWQQAGKALAGANDKERILTMIRQIGMRPSKHVPGHPRWSRAGVSVADLTDMANEMGTGLYLPPLIQEVFFLKPGESPEALLRRIYQRLDTSLAKGLPAILSLRRYALRHSSGPSPQWTFIDAHFVTLISIPRSLDKQARAFPVTYIDPWGARRCQGSIAISTRAVMADSAGISSCLEADFPQCAVGKNRLRRGESSVLVLGAAIGRW